MSQLRRLLDIYLVPLAEAWDDAPLEIIYMIICEWIPKKIMTTCGNDGILGFIDGKPICHDTYGQHLTYDGISILDGRWAHYVRGNTVYSISEVEEYPGRFQIITINNGHITRTRHDAPERCVVPEPICDSASQYRLTHSTARHIVYSASDGTSIRATLFKRRSQKRVTWHHTVHERIDAVHVEFYYNNFMAHSFDNVFSYEGNKQPIANHFAVGNGMLIMSGRVHYLV